MLVFGQYHFHNTTFTMLCYLDALI